MADGVEEGKAIHATLARENPFQEFGADMGFHAQPLRGRPRPRLAGVMIAV
jgi:hypothetical protein